MLESDLLCPTRIISQLRDESGDEELSVLPRHTKVIVTGNNRTKSVLLGLQGVVKKAVGLGGWHWLVLKNGIEVKLQRNALSVLEHPTGNEVDEDIDFDGSRGSDGEKDQDFSSGSEVLKPRKPRVPSMKPVIEPAATKYPIHSSYKDIQSSSINVSKPVRDPKKANLLHRLGYISACIRDLDLKIGIAFPYLGFRPQKVDLAKLGTKSLWRYCSHYNIVGIHHHSSREQMLNAVQRHFALQQPMDEIQVLAEFAQALKRLKCNTERVRIPNINNPNL